jgi:hypothetical protein
MKATRAYIASLGTTGVLLAASVLLLTVVSAFVAFDGWPSGTVTARVDKLVLRDRAPAIPVSATASRPATPAAAPAAPATRTAGGVRRVGGGQGVAGERFVPARPGPTTPGAGPVGVPVPLPAPLPSGPEIPSIPVPGGDSVKEQVASGAEQTTGSAGGALDAVSPQLAEIVTATGRTAADAIRNLPLGPPQG